MMKDIPFQKLRHNDKPVVNPHEPKSKTGYGYFWNGVNITSDILANRTPDFVNFQYAEIKVFPL